MVEVECAWFTATPIWNAVGMPIGLPADIETSVQPGTTLVRPIESTSNTGCRIRVIAGRWRIPVISRTCGSPWSGREQVRTASQADFYAASVVKDRIIADCCGTSTDADNALIERRPAVRPVLTRSTPWIRS